MKDECNGNLMLEVVAIRSKLYSARIEGQKTVKKAKGTKSTVVRKRIDFDDYLTCLFENKYITRQQYQIRSRLHVMHTEKQNKIAMNPKDDKRQLIPGTTDTWPWGYRGIEYVEQDELEAAAAEVAEDFKKLEAVEEDISELIERDLAADEFAAMDEVAAIEEEIIAAAELIEKNRKAEEDEVAAAVAAMEAELAAEELAEPPFKRFKHCLG